MEQFGDETLQMCSLGPVFILHDDWPGESARLALWFGACAVYGYIQQRAACFDAVMRGLLC